VRIEVDELRDGLDITITVNWLRLNIFTQARREFVQDNIERVLHQALHNHVCDYVFGNIRCVHYQSVKSQAKRKRVEDKPSNEGECSSSISNQKRDVSEPQERTEGVPIGADQGEENTTGDEEVAESNAAKDVKRNATTYQEEETTASRKDIESAGSLRTPESEEAKRDRAESAEDVKDGDGKREGIGENDKDVERDIPGGLSEKNVDGKRKLNDGDEEEEERCTICLTDFVHDEEIKQLDCAHKFHVECLETWFIDQATCPCCRRCIACNPPNLIRISFQDPWSWLYNF